jgi:dihydroflavonol-4-reductase
MRVFLTGATGFIGGEIARQLRERGDDVVALVRSPEKANGLRALGVDLVRGDLSDDVAIRTGVAGADAVIHAAAVYEIGILAKDRPAMYDANVLGTERVLRAAMDAEVEKAVYMSTAAAFGNTRGKVVDEAYEHPRTGYTSYYEETKVLAHDKAREVAREGLPLVIVQPGGVYGPGDQSQLGNTIDQFLGRRLPMVPFPDFGITLVHRVDVAEGVLLALDKGRLDESYVLGNETATMREIIDTVADLAGRKSPKSMPGAVMKSAIPFGRVLGPIMGFPPNFRELISSIDGVTFWARSDKARNELGFSPRPMREGLREVVVAHPKVAQK